MKKTKEEEMDSCLLSSDGDFISQAVNHVSQVKQVKSCDASKTADIRTIDVDVRMEPDSGADVNLMREHQYKALQNRSRKKPTLGPS